MSTKAITDLQVLRAQQDWLGNQEGPWGYVILSLVTGLPSKVCFAAFERAKKRCLLDCGVSLRTAWLTEKGKELLASSQ